MAVFDDPVFALVHDQRWKGHRSGAQIVNRKDQGAPRGHAHWCWAHEVCFCIFLRKVDARSGRALFYLLFPPHFRTTLHNLTPSVRSSFQQKSLKANENLQFSINISKLSNFDVKIQNKLLRPDCMYWMKLFATHRPTSWNPPVSQLKQTRDVSSSVRARIIWVLVE